MIEREREREREFNTILPFIISGRAGVLLLTVTSFHFPLTIFFFLALSRKGINLACRSLVFTASFVMCVYAIDPHVLNTRMNKTPQHMKG